MEASFSPGMGPGPGECPAGATPAVPGYLLYYKIS